MLVDNGSKDNTFKVLSNLNLPKNIIPLRVEKNIGYGNGILFGLNHAKGEIVSWTHADLQTDVSDVIIGFNQFEENLINKKCMVKGIRKNRNIIDSFLGQKYGNSFVEKLIKEYNIGNLDVLSGKIYSKFITLFTFKIIKGISHT